MTTRPEATVVIPTTGGPTLAAAVASAIDQRDVDVEVVVIVDHDVRERRDQIASSVPSAEVRIADGAGAGAAREMGTRLARAPFVAYLDDDDTWYPDKLARQLPLLDDGDVELVSCRFEYRRAGATTIPDDRPDARRAVPRTVYDGEVELSTWLFHRRRIVSARNLLHTSTLVLRRATARRVGWSPDLARHQDWDFVLRLAAECGRHSVVQLADVLASVGTGGGTSISAGVGWRASLDWCEANRDLMTSDAYVDFLVGQVGRYCVQAHAFRAFSEVVRTAVRAGRPSASAWLLAAAGIVPRPTFERVAHRP